METLYGPVFFISSYDAPLAQRASCLPQHSSLFGPDGAVNYDYIVTNSINSLLIGSKCIPNGTHTVIKNSGMDYNFMNSVTNFVANSVSIHRVANMN